MRLWILAGASLLAACNGGKPEVENQQSLVNEGAAKPAPAPQPVTLTAIDGVTVYGTYYPAAEPKALILLFHQAGSSSGEYADIAPRLARAGYSALAIDQRIGGNLYGANRTMVGYTGKTDYLGALPDLEIALKWADAKGLPVVLWGSSYSASLVFLLANAQDAKNSVKAVIAFSPGEYFDDKKMVEAAAAKVTVPVFVTSANALEEEAAAKAIVAATASTDRLQYVPRSGVHGSSTLNPAKNPAGADENWAAVLGFLKRVFP
ncbi:MAG: alpha/beta hydrolase [Sphingomonas sp.]|uniref:alpha/beta hydrolase n=1 Tax=Sphingomonas sp. TaxID=28214 RepID=UPI0011FB295A|nr:alpha/beta hydrolase [Sphingomonas sp.]THD35320.1 MAG: alpha/beta hydrolase [Sphingomonas sp.]